MLRNYLTVARRLLARNPVYAAINVGGLAVGLAAALLITVFVLDELGYDRQLPQAERVARLTRETSALSSAPMGPAIASGLSGVESAVRFVEQDDAVYSADGSDERIGDRLLFADSTFFDIFQPEFLAGDPQTALDRPDAIVLTESLARRVFSSLDVVGRTIFVDDGTAYEREVTGVIRDVPRRSHFHYGAVTSFKVVEESSSRMTNWTTNWLYTYVLLDEAADLRQVDSGLQAFMEQRAGTDLASFRLMPITDIHLHSNVSYELEPQGSIGVVIGLSAVALLILLIACANFTNMSVALASRRAREIGMRKALGARRKQLVAQFLGEAFLLVALAGVVAVILAAGVLPEFNRLAGKQMAMTDLLEPSILMTWAAILALTGLTGGAYPSWVLSRYRPADVMRGASSPAGAGRLRNVLVAGQFAVSMFLIVTTLFVYRQIRFMQTKDLGFGTDNRLVVGVDESILADRADTARDLFRSVPGVRDVSFTNNVPGDGVSDFLYRPEGWPDPDNLPGWDTYFVDAGFVQTMGIEVLSGRALDRTIEGDRHAFLINREAAETLRSDGGEAWSDPIGRQLEFMIPGADGWVTQSIGPVVGVVENFNYRSLRESVQPLILQIPDTAWGTLDTAVLRLETDDVQATVAGIRNAYERLGAESAFEYTFLDRRMTALYNAELRTARIVTWFSALAVLIACMGLFAVSSYAATSRAREIGIRKVFGATEGGIARQFVRRYTVLVLASAVIAVPAAWFAVMRWLAEFAYHIDPAVSVFLLGAGMGITLVLAIATISWHAYRSATMNPADVLRHA
jgi:putative ABC transport system permease protein